MIKFVQVARLCLLFSIMTEAAILSTRTLSTEDLIRVRASTDEGQSTIVEWQGQVLYVCSSLSCMFYPSELIHDRSYKPGEAPAVIFNVRGMNIARAKKLQNGSYDLLSRDLQLYLDPVTNEILHTWHNPYSGENVTGPYSSIFHLSI